MTSVEIEQALLARLAAMPGIPGLVGPNDPDATPLPRLVAQVSGTAVRTATLSGTTDATAEIAVRVETKADEDAGANDALVAALLAWFPVGLRLGAARIMDPPSPRPPLVDGGLYARPVLIRARAFH